MQDHSITPRLFLPMQAKWQRSLARVSSSLLENGCATKWAHHTSLPPNAALLLHSRFHSCPPPPAEARTNIQQLSEITAERLKYVRLL